MTFRSSTNHLAGPAVCESDAIHLNAKGSQLVANAVADYLAAYKLSAP